MLRLLAPPHLCIDRDCFSVKHGINPMNHLPNRGFPGQCGARDFEQAEFGRRMRLLLAVSVPTLPFPSGERVDI